MHKFHNQLGFSAVEVLLILIVVGILGFSGWYVWHSKKSTNKNNTNVPTQTIPANGTAVFSGTATVLSDECAEAISQSKSGGLSKHPLPPPGDVGCDIMVTDNNEIIRDIQVMHGNAMVKTWGKAVDFSLSQDISGETVQVKAHQSKGSYYELSGADDYVKFVPQPTQQHNFVRVN